MERKLNICLILWVVVITTLWIGGNKLPFGETNEKISNETGENQVESSYPSVFSEITEID